MTGVELSSIQDAALLFILETEEVLVWLSVTACFQMLKMEPGDSRGEEQLLLDRL